MASRPLAASSSTSAATAVHPDQRHGRRRARGARDPRRGAARRLIGPRSSPGGTCGPVAHPSGRAGTRRSPWYVRRQPVERFGSRADAPFPPQEPPTPWPTSSRSPEVRRKPRSAACSLRRCCRSSRCFIYYFVWWYKINRELADLGRKSDVRISAPSRACRSSPCCSLDPDPAAALQRVRHLEAPEGRPGARRHLGDRAWQRRDRCAALTSSSASCSPATCRTSSTRCGVRRLASARRELLLPRRGRPGDARRPRPSRPRFRASRATSPVRARRDRRARAPSSALAAGFSRPPALRRFGAASGVPPIGRP